MRRLPLIAFALLIVGCQAAEEHAEVASEYEAEAEWTVLFDGTSLDNFRGFGREDVPAAWSIDDGALAFTPGVDDRGDLITKGQYGDFELALEWMISPAGNSGIIYRASEEFGAPWMTGPEYQVLDNALHPDALFGRDRQAGANYDMHPTDSLATRPVGEWNQTRIVAHGNHVEHWLNGQKVVEYELHSEEWNAAHAGSKWVDHPNYGTTMSGHIALQDHSDPVWYRNIRIRTH